MLLWLSDTQVVPLLKLHRAVNVVRKLNSMLDKSIDIYCSHDYINYQNLEK